MPREKFEFTVLDDSFDFDQARIEWQILSLWDELPDCFKSRRVIDEVFQLVQSSPDLIVKMTLKRPNLPFI